MAVEHTRAALRDRGAHELLEAHPTGIEDIQELLFWLADYDQIVNVAWVGSGGLGPLRGATWGLHATISEATAAVMEADPLEIYQSAPPVVNILFSDLGLVLVGRDALAVDTVAAAIHGIPDFADPILLSARSRGLPQTRLENVALYGVPLEAASRPCPGTVVDEGCEKQGHHVFVHDACTYCGRCAAVCPTRAISFGAQSFSIDVEKCISCHVCTEVCPENCLRPDAEATAGVMVPNLGGLRAWLGALEAPDEGDAVAELGGASHARSSVPEEVGCSRPIPTKPKSLTILGLSILTQMEHAAALVIDGRILGSVAEERFCRIKHYGWRRPGARGTTLGNDLSLSIEQVLCWRSIHSLLKTHGKTLDDVDIFAINGIPARYRRSYSLTDAGRPPQILRSGKLVFVPHHLAHAASAFRVSGFDEASIFTVDGSGDRETAAFFGATSSGAIEQVFDIPTAGHCSIGGVYETVTQILGFGEWGQGSTMALAGSGEPAFDMSSILAATSRTDLGVDYDLAYERFRHLSRERRSPVTEEHRNLAASVQHALEETVLALVRDGLGSNGTGNLCLAGGVALNCSMNARLRREAQPTGLFVQPAANDAGTALGAALEAHRYVTGDNPECGVMEHAGLGPAFDDSQIQETLKLFGVSHRPAQNMPEEVAQRIADGQIVCWFQGPMEHGPRALGRRSILADPRAPELKKRLNQMKGREPWRPFGPSILSGREKDYFEAGFHSPFMLFTVTVRPEKRTAIPVVVHVDGTTRPQSVRTETHPLYHAMIQAFDSMTGVPMVVNTSFNTAFEPIVCTPADALASFAMLRADVLAMGGFIVERNGAE